MWKEPGAQKIAITDTSRGSSQLIAHCIINRWDNMKSVLGSSADHIHDPLYLWTSTYLGTCAKSYYLNLSMIKNWIVVIILCACCILSLSAQFALKKTYVCREAASLLISSRGSVNQSLISDRDHIYNSASISQDINIHVLFNIFITSLMCLNRNGVYWLVVSTYSEIVNDICNHTICIIVKNRFILLIKS